MDTAELLVTLASLAGMLLVALMAVIPTAMESGPDEEPRRRARPRAAGHGHPLAS